MAAPHHISSIARGGGNVVEAAPTTRYSTVQLASDGDGDDVDTRVVRTTTELFGRLHVTEVRALLEEARCVHACWCPPRCISLLLRCEALNVRLRRGCAGAKPERKTKSYEPLWVKGTMTCCTPRKRLPRCMIAWTTLLSSCGSCILYVLPSSPPRHGPFSGLTSHVSSIFVDTDMHAGHVFASKRGRSSHSGNNRRRQSLAVRRRGSLSAGYQFARQLRTGTNRCKCSIAH